MATEADANRPRSLLPPLPHGLDGDVVPVGDTLVADPLLLVGFWSWTRYCNELTANLAT